jgi:hypothetical protein
MTKNRSTTASMRTQPSLLMGTNSCGEWVVRDRTLRRGGVFVSRASALRYVRLETGEREPRVTMVAGNLELDVLRVDGVTGTAGDR